VVSESDELCRKGKFSMCTNRERSSRQNVLWTTHHTDDGFRSSCVTMRITLLTVLRERGGGHYFVLM